MPEPRLNKELKSAGQGFTTIEQLAKLLHTSLTATAIRYTSNTDYAVAVVMSNGQQIDYCFMSERIRDLNGIDHLDQKA